MRNQENSTGREREIIKELEKIYLFWTKKNILILDRKCFIVICFTPYKDSFNEYIRDFWSHRI